MPAGKRIKLSIATGGDNLIMQITLDTKPFATLETDALVTYVFENGDLTQGRPAELDKLTGGMLSRLSKSGELTGKSLETTLLHAPAGFKAAREFGRRVVATWLSVLRGLEFERHSVKTLSLAGLLVH